MDVLAVGRDGARPCDLAQKRRVDPGLLLDASEALQRVQIHRAHFLEVGRFVRTGDLVYADSPYDGVFDGYDCSKFGDDAQIHLRDQAARLAERGVFVMLTNANTVKVRAWYGSAPFVVRELSTVQTIATKSESRGRREDLLITTYE